MKKIILFFLLFLTACQSVTPVTLDERATALPDVVLPTVAAPTAETPAVPADLSPQGQEVVLWHAMTGAAAASLTHALARFNTANDWDISVYPRAFPSYADLYQSLQDAEDEALPDIVVASPDVILRLDAEGKTRDLTLYWQDADWGLNAAAQDDFFAVFLQPVRVDGRLLGLPAQMVAHGLIYNQTWAREMGFDAAPMDAESFQEQVCAANETFRLRDADETNDGFGGWIVARDPQMALGWLGAFSGRLDDGEGAYAFVSEENAAALVYLKSLFDDACAWLPDSQAVLPPYYEQFAARTALALGGSSAEADLLNAYLAREGVRDEWLLIPFPGPRGGAYALDGIFFSLLAADDARALAGWVFLRWMLSPEEQEDWASQSGYLPARKSAYEAMSAYASAHPQWDFVMRHLDESVNPPALPSWGLGQQVLADGFYLFFYQNWSADHAENLLEMMQATMDSLEE